MPIWLVVDRIKQPKLEAEGERVPQRLLDVVHGAGALLHTLEQGVVVDFTRVHVTAPIADRGAGGFLGRLAVVVLRVNVLDSARVAGNIPLELPLLSKDMV